MIKSALLDEETRLRMEIEALQLANAALEQQLLLDAEYTTKMLRMLEIQKSELGEANLRLKGQSDFIQRVMDTTSALMIVLESEGRMRQVNRHCVEKLINDDVVLKDSVLDDWLHPDEQKALSSKLPKLPWQVFSPFFEVVRQNGFYSCEHQLRERNGSYRYYLLEASMLYSPQGKREGAVVSAIDITQIRRQQDLLLRSEKLLKEAQNIAQLGHWEFDLNSGEMTYSEEIYHILEYHPAVGKQSMEDFLSLVHPDDYQVVKVKFNSQSFSAEPYTLEYRLLFENGRIKWVQNRFITYFDRNEKTINCALRTVGTLQDITAKHIAEEQLKLAACVFDNSLNGILITDANSKIIKVNAVFCDITGYSAEEVYGRTPSILRSKHHDENYYRQLWSELNQRGEWQGEIWNRRKNGELYQQLLSISAIYDNNKEIVQYVGVFADVTEQRRLEEHLRQSQKLEAIGTLVGGIAHDFNNTLAAIQGNVDLARLYNKNNSAVASKLDDVERLGEHSAEIIQQLLTFARKGMVKMAPVSLNLLFSHQKRIAKSFFPENISFELYICEEQLTVLGDMSQLQQVMLNLFNNARDAVEACQQPIIECRLESFEADNAFMNKHNNLTENKLAHITVRDNGNGIADKDLPHVFEPFYTTKDVGKGTGLGMSMVYGSMQTHRGVIELKSKQDEGTCVHMYLPLVEEKERENAIPKTKMEKSEKRLCVLLVDDNIDVRNTYRETLESNNYDVIVADNGVEALDRFSKNIDRIGLVISDIVMPRMGGFQAVSRMREQNQLLPVIFITGYDPETNIPIGLRDKSHVLCKPFSLKSLFDLIQQLIKKDEGS